MTHFLKNLALRASTAIAIFSTIIPCIIYGAIFVTKTEGQLSKQMAHINAHMVRLDKLEENQKVQDIQFAEIKVELKNITAILIEIKSDLKENNH